MFKLLQKQKEITDAIAKVMRLKSNNYLSRNIYILYNLTEADEEAFQKKSVLKDIYVDGEVRFSPSAALCKPPSPAKEQPSSLLGNIIKQNTKTKVINNEYKISSKGPIMSYRLTVEKAFGSHIHMKEFSWHLRDIFPIIDAIPYKPRRVLLEMLEIYKVIPKTVLQEEGIIGDQVILVMSGTVDIFRKIGNVYQKKELGPNKDKVGFRAWLSTMKFGTKILAKQSDYHNPFLIGETTGILGIDNPISVVTQTECILVVFKYKPFFQYLQTATNKAIAEFEHDCQSRLNQITEVAKNRVHGIIASQEYVKEIQSEPRFTITKCPRDLSKRDLPNSIYAAEVYEEDVEVKLKRNETRGFRKASYINSKTDEMMQSAFGNIKRQNIVKLRQKLVNGEQMKMGASACGMKPKKLTGYIDWNDLVKLEKLKRDIEEYPEIHGYKQPKDKFGFLDQAHHPMSYSKVRPVTLKEGASIEEQLKYDQNDPNLEPQFGVPLRGYVSTKKNIYYDEHKRISDLNQKEKSQVEFERQRVQSNIPRGVDNYKTNNNYSSVILKRLNCNTMMYKGSPHRTLTNQTLTPVIERTRNLSVQQLSQNVEKMQQNQSLEETQPSSLIGNSMHLTSIRPFLQNQSQEGLNSIDSLHSKAGHQTSQEWGTNQNTQQFSSFMHQTSKVSKKNIHSFRKAMPHKQNQNDTLGMETINDYGDSLLNQSKYNPNQVQMSESNFSQSQMPSVSNIKRHSRSNSTAQGFNLTSTNQQTSDDDESAVSNQFRMTGKYRLSASNQSPVQALRRQKIPQIKQAKGRSVSSLGATTTNAKFISNLLDQNRLYFGKPTLRQQAHTPIKELM